MVLYFSATGNTEFVAKELANRLGDEVLDLRDRIRETCGRLPAVAETIRNGGRLPSRHVWLFEILVSVPFNPVWCRTTQGVGDFYATDSCISCGKCERVCPLRVILPDANGRPVWTGKTCAHCMSCIQNCPAEAIEYGRKTQQKKRYRFDKYRYSVP